jgi:hypothetical protein
LLLLWRVLGLVVTAMVLLLVAMMLLATMLRRHPMTRDLRHWRRDCIPALQVDIDSSGVLLSLVLQSHLTANLFNPRLYLLDMIGRVIALAHNDMKVRLATSLISTNAVLKDILGLFYKLTMQINAVPGHAALRIVLSEDKLASLFVVFLHLGTMSLAFFAELLCFGAIATGVRRFRLCAQQQFPMLVNVMSPACMWHFTFSKQALRFAAS